MDENAPDPAFGGGPAALAEAFAAMGIIDPAEFDADPDNHHMLDDIQLLCRMSSVY